MTKKKTGSYISQKTSIDNLVLRFPTCQLTLIITKISNMDDYKNMIKKKTHFGCLGSWDEKCNSSPKKKYSQKLCLIEKIEKRHGGNCFPNGLPLMTAISCIEDFLFSVTAKKESGLMEYSILYVEIPGTGSDC